MGTRSYKEAVTDLQSEVLALKLEVEKLETDLERLQAALMPFAELPTVGSDDSIEPDHEWLQPVSNRRILTARAAIDATRGLKRKKS